MSKKVKVTLGMIIAVMCICIVGFKIKTYYEGPDYGLTTVKRGVLNGEGISNTVEKGYIGRASNLVNNTPRVTKGDSTIWVQFKSEGRGYVNLYYTAKDVETAKSLLGKKIEVLEMHPNPYECRILELKKIE